MKLFLNQEGRLREIWWVPIFFFILAILTLPVILLSNSYGFDVNLFLQATVILAATWICQWLSRKPMLELTGKFDSTLLRNILTGLFLGMLLMLVPSFILYAGGWVAWEVVAPLNSNLASISLTIAAGAIAEEFLFRGFVFQRLNKSLGQWPAQIILSGYFLLTHANNPELSQETKTLAMVNIFAASLLFGIVVLRTNSLWIAVAMHFAANWTQGVLLGFGVSGHSEGSMLRPILQTAPEWITGGAFGLEASLPGTIVVILFLFWFYLSKPQPIQG